MDGMMNNQYVSRILNRLLDKYEESKSFIGTNQVKQYFYLYPDKEFKGYNDDSDYDTFVAVNDAVFHLDHKGYISFTKERSGVIKRLWLIESKIPDIYTVLKRKPKEEENIWLTNSLDSIELKDSPILMKYIAAQRLRLLQNKKVEFYDNDHTEYENLLKAILFAETNEKEIFIRDASVQLFGDSKYFEKILQKVQLLMFAYGDYEEKETVMEECGVVRTPTYVTIKGDVTLNLLSQSIDLSRMKGDIALSTKTIEELKDMKVTGNRVITIENLTTFHDYDGAGACCIYLGGFHNKTKRMFLKDLYERNPGKEYYHFGDMDAGGFYIYDHLVEKTGIPFQLLHMDIITLQENQNIWKTLTKNDQIRLEKLLQKQIEKDKNSLLQVDYREIIQYMLNHNCKIEQEGLHIMLEIDNS